MNIQRPLVPGFLKKIDQQLLLNKPGIYSTRVHLVLYYGLLFMAALTVLSFLEPVDVRERSTTAVWIGFVSIISTIALVVWLIYLLRFNVFKKYGQIRPLQMLVAFLLYFVCIGTIISFCYVHPAVESIKANKAFGDEEIVKDMNMINTKISQLEYERLRQDWGYDTLVWVKNKTMPDEYNEAEVGRRRTYVRVDSNTFFNRINYTDSLVKLNDTMYILYETPVFTFIDFYRVDELTKGKLQSSFQIYNYVSKHLPRGSERAVIAGELNTVLKKYDVGERRVFEPPVDATFQKIQQKYRTESVERSMQNLVEKKYRWRGTELEIYLRIFYYCTLCLTLLIFIFRHSTVRTFFLTLLAAILLTIFTALVASFAHFSDLSGLGLTIGYIILFFIGSLLVFRSKKRSAVTGIMINLFVFSVTALPGLLLAWYYAWWRYRSRYLDSPEDYFEVELWMVAMAEVGGVILLLTLLATYIYRLYRRWYALPEH